MSSGLPYRIALVTSLLINERYKLSEKSETASFEIVLIPSSLLAVSCIFLYLSTNVGINAAASSLL